MAYRPEVRIGLLTREFPPDVYGGAGVHVEHLVPALRGLVDVEVHCFGEPRAESPGTHAYRPPSVLGQANPALQTLGVDLAMVAALADVDIVHSHTWYTNMAGHLAGLLHGVPHVVTAHSLEPRRPWKAEQLGAGYRLSSWVERTAYEHADAVSAVSDGMRRDVLECYPALDPARVHVWCTTASTQVSITPTPPGTPCALPAWTRTAPAWCSSDGSPGRKGSGTWSLRRTGSAATRRSCCAPARPTRPRSPRRPGRPSPS